MLGMTDMHGVQGTNINRRFYVSDPCTFLPVSTGSFWHLEAIHHSGPYGQFECKRLDSTNENAWSVVVQVGAQVLAVTQMSLDEVRFGRSAILTQSQNAKSRSTTAALRILTHHFLQTMADDLPPWRVKR